MNELDHDKGRTEAGVKDRKYQVWVILEEWDGNENKICDIETLLVDERRSLKDSTTVFGAVQRLVIAAMDDIKDIVEQALKESQEGSL